MKSLIKVESESASEQIDAKIERLGDWRGKTLAAMHKLIHAAQAIRGSSRISYPRCVN